MARRKTGFDLELLNQTIVDLESDRKFSSRSDLFKAICEKPWAVEAKLTPSIIYLRVKEFNIELKTPLGKRGQAVSKLKKIKFDVELLKQTLHDLESSQNFINRSALYNAVCAQPWAVEAKLTPSVVYLRVKEFNIELKTPVGKRGQRSGIVSNDPFDLSLLRRCFEEYGVNVTNIESILTSSSRSDKENDKIRLGWGELRRVLNMPTPKTKSA